MDLDELLAELESESGSNVEEDINEEEEKTETESETEEDEDFNLEEMSEADLEGFIKEVVQEMADSGELEGGSGEAEETEAEEVTEAKVKKMPTKPKVKQMKENKNLREAVLLKQVEKMKNELQEVNVLNAKLLYASKIFKSKNLSESQKTKVLDAFDKATTVKGAKLIYETLIETLIERKTSITENLKLGSSSKAIMSSKKKEGIVDADGSFARMVELAGIK